MGQAKNRGTFEERKAKAIARDKLEAEQRAEREKKTVITVGNDRSRVNRRVLAMAVASALAPPPILVEVKPKRKGVK